MIKYNFDDIFYNSSNQSYLVVYIELKQSTWSENLHL
jgi:hypothetical protein